MPAEKIDWIKSLKNLCCFKASAICTGDRRWNWQANSELYWVSQKKEGRLRSKFQKGPQVFPEISNHLESSEQ